MLKFIILGGAAFTFAVATITLAILYTKEHRKHNNCLLEEQRQTDENENKQDVFGFLDGRSEGQIAQLNQVDRFLLSSIHPRSSKLLRDTLISTTRILDAFNVSYTMAFGTLLSVERTLPPHGPMLNDDDLDIYVHWRDHKRVQQALQSFSDREKLHFQTFDFGFQTATRTSDEESVRKEFLLDIFFVRDSRIWHRPYDAGADEEVKYWGNWNVGENNYEDRMFTETERMMYWGIKNISCLKHEPRLRLLKQLYGDDCIENAKLYNHTHGHVKGSFSTNVYPLLRVPQSIVE